VFGAGVPRRVEAVLPALLVGGFGGAGETDHDQAVGKAQRELNRLGQTRPDLRFEDQPIDHRFYRVLPGLRQFGRALDLVNLPVDPHPNESFPLNPLEDVAVLTFLAPEDGSEYHQATADRKLGNLVDDLRYRLGSNWLPTDPAVRLADSCK